MCIFSRKRQLVVQIPLSLLKKLNGKRKIKPKHDPSFNLSLAKGTEGDRWPGGATGGSLYSVMLMLTTLAPLLQPLIPHSAKLQAADSVFLFRLPWSGQMSAALKSLPYALRVKFNKFLILLRRKNVLICVTVFVNIQYEHFDSNQLFIK